MALYRIQLFSTLKEKLGKSRLEIELDPPPHTVEEFLISLAEKFPNLSETLKYCRVALNHEYVQNGDPLNPEQEIALIPPVSGG